jgi:hypothetical protein
MFNHPPRTLQEALETAFLTPRPAASTRPPEPDRPQPQPQPQQQQQQRRPSSRADASAPGTHDTSPSSPS